MDGGHRCLSGWVHPQQGNAVRHKEGPWLEREAATPHLQAPKGALRGVRCGGQVLGRRGLLHQAASQEGAVECGGVHPPPGQSHRAHFCGVVAVSAGRSGDVQHTLEHVLGDMLPAVATTDSKSVYGHVHWGR